MLNDDYPDDFLKLWSVYPKIPTGRSKKRPSYLAFQRAKRVLKFDAADIEAISRDIQSRLISCETWQPGNKFGAPMLATYLNQRLWNEPYEKTSRYRAPVTAAHREFEPSGAPVQSNPEVARAALAASRRMLH